MTLVKGLKISLKKDRGGESDYSEGGFKEEA